MGGGFTRVGRLSGTSMLSCDERIVRNGIRIEKGKERIMRARKDVRIIDLEGVDRAELISELGFAVARWMEWYGDGSWTKWDAEIDLEGGIGYLAQIEARRFLVMSEEGWRKECDELEIDCIVLVTEDCDELVLVDDSDIKDIEFEALSRL